MNNNWIDAAKVYAKAAAQNPLPANSVILSDPLLPERDVEREISTAATRVDSFLREEGDAIKALLTASGRSINLIDDNEGGGINSGFLLNGDGLREYSGRGESMADAYGHVTAGKKPDPIPLLPGTVLDLVRLWHRKGGNLNDIVMHIRSGLDRVAAAAPSLHGEIPEVRRILEDRMVR